MKVLVTSGNGKVGSATVAALVKAGVATRVGARDLAKARKEFPGAEAVAFDYADEASMAAALKGVDAVFTAAPYWLLPQAEATLVKLAKAAGVKRIVKLSAAGTEHFPTSPHGQAEQAIRDSGLAWTFLRPNFFMQNYATMSAGSIKAQGQFYEPAAEGATAFVDARDIADVAVTALTKDGHAGQAYTLTGGEALNRTQVAQKIAKASGRPVAYVPVDDAALRQAMAGAPPSLIELMSQLFGMVRGGMTAGVSGDVQKVLGRPPRSFDTFAADHAAVWRG